MSNNNFINAVKAVESCNTDALNIAKDNMSNEELKDALSVLELTGHWLKAQLNYNTSVINNK